MTTKLSVNINKVALIRNSRGSNVPDIIKFAQDCEEFGADGITVHPRPDQRHIRYYDLKPLKEVVQTEFNIEGYPSEEFLTQVISVCPHQCTLVPDPPGVLTSDSGWQIDKNVSFLTDVIKRLKDHGIRVSLFIDPEVKQVDFAKSVGADRIELYTGQYANHYAIDPKKAVLEHSKCSALALKIGIGVNAGHDLNLNNLAFYSRELVSLHEVSIGHAIVTDALYYGIKNTIGMYKGLLD